jgi:hypothetical protein
MAGHPDAATLLAAVRDFLGGLRLEGRDAFHAKVAGNVLAIVERELTERPDAGEAAALHKLRRHPGESRDPWPAGLGPGVRRDDGVDGIELAALRADICVGLRDGRLTLATPGLLDALVAANLARLAVDNPRYSTFLRRTAASAPQR